MSTRSPTGDQDTPRRHVPADEPSSELAFTVFDKHTTWLLSVPMLQRLYFAFYYEGEMTLLESDYHWAILFDDDDEISTPLGNDLSFATAWRPHVWP